MIVVPCCQASFIFWGSYHRTLLPIGQLVWIHRVRCKVCGATHAVIPALLFGYVRYPASTLSAYFEQAIEVSRQPIETWHLNMADGPQNFETLYRWLHRLRGRLSALLPLLKSELLKLEPAFDFSPLQELILKSQKPLPQHGDEDHSSHSQTPQSEASPPAIPKMSRGKSLSIVALCALSYWLSKNVLHLAGELLTVESVLSPIAFLNYFCWQRTGTALISPPQKSRPP